MNRLIPTPTPQDIEAALTATRDGTIAYVRWRRLEEQIEVVFIPYDGVSVPWAWLYNSESFRRPSAHTDRLWWVTIIDPDGVEFGMFGGGATLAEAAAVACSSSCTRHRYLLLH
jgi:hypothetical protein